MQTDPREVASIATLLSGVEVEDAGDVTVERIGEPERPASATAGLYRVRGDGPAPWSAVVKLLSPTREAHPRWRTSEDPSHWYWWRREERAYASGLLDRLTGGLRSPRYLGTFERSGGAVALWLEDVAAPGAEMWDIQRYGLCARQLARAQWRFAADPPDEAWLARDFIAGYLDRHTDVFATGLPDTDLVRRARAVFDDRARLLDVLHALPVTLCHNDFHAFNLFGEEEDKSIAIDWSFVGLGPLTLDAGALPPDAVLDYGSPVGTFRELTSAVADGYVEGLRDAGWSGDEDLVRLGLLVAGGLKFIWVAGVVAAPDDAQFARWETRYGRPGDTVRRDWTELAEGVLDLADEAAAALRRRGT